MGRYLPDGTIQFLGRQDFQVKIQGQRIELGEIEATLAQHPSVRTAVAMVVNGQGGAARLIAYAVASEYPERSHEAPAAIDEVRTDEANVITDPIGRAEFKLKRHGLRQFESGRPTVELPKPAPGLLERYASRSSHRSFQSAPIDKEQLAELLGHLMPIDVRGLPKYRYASAGGLYPVQVFLDIKPGGVRGLTAGSYYYRPDAHHLVQLSLEGQLDRNIHVPTNQAIFDAAAFSLFLVGRISAIAPLYGALARDFCLLEAGYLSQLLMTEAQSLGIGLCPIGGFKEEARLRRSLELGADDVLLHSMLGGRNLARAGAVA